MKKLISVLCVFVLAMSLFAATAISTSAEENAQTVVDVKTGDEVTYQLTLGGVSTKIIGCDFSFYYDPDLLEVSSVADFNDSTDESTWQELINTALTGEVRGNWSILSGVDFSSDRHFLTITYKAKASGSAHLSYFIRYMYDDSIFDSTDKPQITEYKFTCDVLLNGEKVIEKAAPELNTEETQTTGLFVNSVTGDSKDADPDIPGTVVNREAVPSNQNIVRDPNQSPAPDNTPDNNSNNAANNGNNNSNQSANKTATDAPKETTPPATTAEGYYVSATDASGNVTATSDEAPAVTTGADSGKGGSSPVLWIIIILVVLAGGGAAAFYYMKNKKPSADAPAEPENTKPEE